MALTNLASLLSDRGLTKPVALEAQRIGQLPEDQEKRG